VNKKEEWISYAETKICDCGTADGLADLAKQVLEESERLESQALRQAYYLIRSEIGFYAGIHKELVHSEWMDDLIRQY